jgi:hypothetical protein
MLTHVEIVRAITRASLDPGFAILDRRQLSRDDSRIDEIRIVRNDRLHLAPPRGATITLRHPDVLLTEIEVRGSPAPDIGPDCSQIDLSIAYHIPYPACLDLNRAVPAARAVRAYLIEALALNPPPPWVEAEDADEEDLTNLFDSIFSVRCTVIESGGEQRGVEIRLDQLWVFAHEQPTNEAEIEGESEAILTVIDQVWQILLPAGHRDDPLAPLSFLLPPGEKREA